MLYWVSPIYFAIFVLSTQFVLVNVVVAVLMKQLEDSKDSIGSNNDDSISDIDESFSNEHKIDHSDDDYEASANYATEARDICLVIGDEADKNGNTEMDDPLRETRPGCEITVTDETTMQRRESDKETSKIQERDDSFDKASLHGEYGLENAIIVVSPALGHGHENTFIPNMSNEEDSYYEMKSSSFLGFESDDGHPEITLCRSMPELSTSPMAESRRLLFKTKESQSCPQTMSLSKEEAAKSKCKRLALDRPFLAKKRSRSKVAPLTRGLTVPSQTLSVHDDILSSSVPSNIES